MYLYKITNCINKKTYFGITKDIKERFDYHRTRAFQTIHREYEKPLYRAFRKYGLDNFEFEILESGLTIDKAKERETECIEEFNSTTHENGYNITRGGDYNGAYGEEHHNAILTEKEARDIIERRKKGEARSDVYKLYEDKLSFGGFTNVWQGRTWSHIDPEFSNREKGVKGVKNGNSIFTEEDVISIRTRRKEGQSRIAVYRDFIKTKECSEAAFNRVWYYYTYKDIVV